MSVKSLKLSLLAKYLRRQADISQSLLLSREEFLNKKEYFAPPASLLCVPSQSPFQTFESQQTIKMKIARCNKIFTPRGK
jgi:hypothetical protein